MELTGDQRAVLTAIEATLQARLDAMGADESGLASLYARKLADGALMWPCGPPALSFIAGNPGRWRRVWDIGAGVGQLAAMVAAGGDRVVAIEHNERRYAALEAVFSAAIAVRPALADRLDGRFEAFPDGVAGEDVRRDLALVFGCAFVASRDAYQAFETALARFDAALVEFGALFTGGATPPDERDGDGRAAAFCARHGLPPPIRLFGFGPGQQYGVHLVGHGLG